MEIDIPRSKSRHRSQFGKGWWDTDFMDGQGKKNLFLTFEFSAIVVNLLLGDDNVSKLKLKVIYLPLYSFELISCSCYVR